MKFLRLLLAVLNFVIYMQFNASGENMYQTRIHRFSGRALVFFVFNILTLFFSNYRANSAWLDDQMNQYTSITSRLVQSDKDRQGLLITALAQPAAGRLIIRKTSGGDPEFCSASLISSRHVLTAAHCVCGVYKDFKQCQAKISLNDQSYTFYSYLVGALVGHKAQVAENFNVNNVRKAPLGSSLGDIAVITLDSDTSAPAIKMGITRDGALLSVIGFGRLAVTEEGAKAIGISPATYLDGIGVEAYPASYDCALKHKDIICTQYNSDMVRDYAHSSVVCGGDSGGPLIVRNANGVSVIAGVTSNRINFGQTGCIADDSAQSIFTSIEPYRFWLDSILENSQIESVNKYICRELPFTMPSTGKTQIELDAQGVNHLVTVTLANFEQSYASSYLKLDPNMAPMCNAVANRSDLMQCDVPKGSPLTLALEGQGLVHIVDCASKTGDFH